MNINYLTDNSGNKVAVQIPLNEWSKLIEDYNRLRQYYDLKEILTESFHEIEEIEKGYLRQRINKDDQGYKEARKRKERLV